MLPELPVIIIINIIIIIVNDIVVIIIINIIIIIIIVNDIDLIQTGQFHISAFGWWVIRSVDSLCSMCFPNIFSCNVFVRAWVLVCVIECVGMCVCVRTCVHVHVCVCVCVCFNIKPRECNVDLETK